MMFLSLSLRRKRKGDCMAKAVLVMDMPETCCDCRFCRELHEGVEACCELEDEPNDNKQCRMIDDYCYHKPDWCPLRELPDEKCGAWTDGMIAAYNKYLSEVLERKE